MLYREIKPCLLINTSFNVFRAERHKKGIFFRPAILPSYSAKERSPEILRPTLSDGLPFSAET
jgi:hypothetical protein